MVAYNASGKAVEEKSIHTPGKPHHIQLEADQNILHPDGKDLSFVRVGVVDQNGNLCSDDSTQIILKLVVPVVAGQ